MRIQSHRRDHSGFSLIEVLIAVVVLATGLLAMAALQGKLAGNSADAKARSRVAALLTSVMDDERATGYGSLASFATTVCTTTTPTTLQTAICAAESDAGISGLGLTQTVTTYYGLSGGGAFTTTVPAAGAHYADYKNVRLTAGWADATGATRSIGATTIASSLGLSSSTTLLTSPLTKSGITPVVHEANPGLTAGVIPIAVGANTDAASTNPQPTLAQTLPSTSFNTLTYTQGGLDTSKTATIQKRVETTVAQCVCKWASSGNPLSSDVFLGATTYRPTYWNGLKYVAAANAMVTPYSAQDPSLVGNQSDMCTVVCRDHHDASDGSDTIRFDSVTGDYKRYKVATTTINVKGVNTTVASVPVTLALDGSGNPIPAVAGDIYLDAARLIRVDGLWRVATDMHAEHMGLLATAPKGFATTSTPDTSSEAAYGAKTGFVVDYIGKKLTQLLSSGPAPVANTIFGNHGLDTPTTIDAVTTTGTYRYLHARGLYLDTLEQPAKDKLNSVNSSCTDYPTCLLPYVPFNTINVTQLANWAPTTAKIGVTNNTTSNTATACSGSTVIRACVSGKSVTSTGDGTAAVVTMGKSNSAVAASIEVNPYERNSSNKLSDSQAFTVSGTDTASEFFAALTGDATTLGSTILPFWTDDLSTTNDPSVQWKIGSDLDYCFANLSRTDTNPNPYDCVTTVSLATPVTLTVGNYNQVVPQSVDANTVCPGATGTVSQPTLVCYKVSLASDANVSGVTGYTTGISVVGTARTTTEQTVISIIGPSPIPKSQATLNLKFSVNGTAAGSATCDAVTNVPTFTAPTACPP